MGCGDRESKELRITLGVFLEQPGRWERRFFVGCGVTKSSTLGKWSLRCLLNTHMGVSYRQLLLLLLLSRFSHVQLCATP